MRYRRTIPCLVLAGALLGAGGCQGFREWAREVERQPTGVGIQGSAGMKAVVSILRKRLATPEQEEEARVQAEKTVVAMGEKAKAKLLEEGMPSVIAVPVSPGPEAAPETEVTVMLFDVKSQKVVGNEVYDLKGVPDVDGDPPPEVLLVMDNFTVSYFGAN